MGFHPYKIIIQMLNKGDCQQRSAFAEKMLKIIEHEDANIIMSDEAHIHLNKQNF
jgi:hypothetical protein